MREKINAIKKTGIIFQTSEGKVFYEHMLRWSTGPRYPVDHSFSISSLLPTLGLAGIHTQQTQARSLFFREVSGCFYEFLFQDVSILFLARQVSGSSIVGTFRSEHFLSCSFQLLTVFTQGILKASCMALETRKATPPTAQSEPVALRLVARAGHTQCIQNLTVRNWAASWKIKLPFIRGKKGKKEQAIPDGPALLTVASL